MQGTYKAHHRGASKEDAFKTPNATNHVLTRNLQQFRVKNNISTFTTSYHKPRRLRFANFGIISNDLSSSFMSLSIELTKGRH
jgi:hypothetical protein